MDVQFRPTLEEVERLASLPENEGNNLIPVYRELFADLETPVSAFLKIREGNYSFLLESVVLGEQRGRYSFIGTKPFKILEVGDDSPVSGDPLVHLDDAMREFKVVPVAGLPLPPFTGGAVGYLSYDAVKYFEKAMAVGFESKRVQVNTIQRKDQCRVKPNIQKQTDRLQVPDCIYMFCDTLLIFDHVRNTIKVVSHCDLGRTDLATSYQQATSRVEELVAKLQTPIESKLRGVSALSNLARLPHSEWNKGSNVGKDGYMAFVNNLKHHVTGGDIIQAVPSQRIALSFEGGDVSALDIYRQLRVLNPSPYMYYLDLGPNFQIVGASPEMLLKVDEKRIVQTHPIAGTRPRGATPEEDEALAKELLADEKELAEHVMLVDLGRNDVGRVAKPGTVKVQGLMHIEKYSHVMHIVSVVKGELREECSPLDAFRAIFPAGTLTGAPKVKAMELVAGLEPEKRGIYGGSVGYYSFSGVLDTAIAIRTLVIKDGTVYAQAGGGIVYDSDPETEYLETMNKLGAVLAAIQLAAKKGDAAIIPRATT